MLRVECEVWSVEFLDGGGKEVEPEKTVKFKSKRFAVRIVNLYRYLKDEKKEYVLSKQLLRCGTSIGANIAESECAMSTKDFLSKIYVALKECSETTYWLELLAETGYLTKEQYDSIQKDCSELKKMLSATTKTLARKSSLRSPHTPGILNPAHNNGP